MEWMWPLHIVLLVSNAGLIEMKPSDNPSDPSSPHPFHSSTSLPEASSNINNNATMDDVHKDLLLRHQQTFLETLDVQRLYPTLHGHKILTMEDVNAINQQQTPAARVERLLDVLPSKGPHAFQAFCKSLESNYPHLLTSMFFGGSVTNASGNFNHLNLTTILFHWLCVAGVTSWTILC